MKISVSNIAWPMELNESAYSQLARLGVAAIEVAPTRVWPAWQGISTIAIRAYWDQVHASGLQISSLQSILFQKPEMQLFSTGLAAEQFAAHLRFCANLAAELGAKAVVFGAPKNRLRGTRPASEAARRAAEVLLPIAEYYALQGTALCFEANPEQYSCDFVTRAADAAALVRNVNSAGLRLHLDTACAELAGEDVAALVHEHADILTHFHASEPRSWRVQTAGKLSRGGGPCTA